MAELSRIYINVLINTEQGHKGTLILIQFHTTTTATYPVPSDTLNYSILTANSTLGLDIIQLARAVLSNFPRVT